MEQEKGETEVFRAGSEEMRSEASSVGRKWPSAEGSVHPEGQGRKFRKELEVEHQELCRPGCHRGGQDVQEGEEEEVHQEGDGE